MIMPKRFKAGIGAGLSGVYSIRTPTGKQYIGSSIDIRRRWYEHHWRMKNFKSSSPQLDRAYAKYGLSMEFTILEICAPENIRAREQWYLDELQPALNVSMDAYCAPLWACKKGASMSAGAEARRCAVEDSNGTIHESITVAAKAFGCEESLLRRRLSSHDPLPCGTRIKRVGDEWKPERPPLSQRKSEAQIASADARRSSGTLRHSEAARLAKSQRSKGIPWSEDRKARFAMRKGGK